MIGINSLTGRMLATALAALFTVAFTAAAAVAHQRTEVPARDTQPAEPAVPESVATDPSPGSVIAPPTDNVARVPVIEGAGGPHVGRHKAPHGGALVPLGEDAAHLEFVLEPETGILTLYVLNGDASAPLLVRQEMVFMKLEAGEGEFAIVLFSRPEDEADEGSGSTARFMAGHRRLTGKTSFDALVEGITVNRQAYRRVHVSYPQGSE